MRFTRLGPSADIGKSNKNHFLGVLCCLWTKLLEIDAPAAIADLVKTIKNDSKYFGTNLLEIDAPAAIADLVKT